MRSATTPTRAQIQIGRPKRFGWAAELILHAHSLLPILLFVVTALLLTLSTFEPWLLLLPILAAIAVMAFILPLSSGNAYLARLVRGSHPAAGKEPLSFVVQLNARPRIRSGLWTTLEDADDVGCLMVTESGLVFQGDSVELLAPYARIREVQIRSAGLRGLFIYGQRVAIRVSGLPNIESFEFAERSSWILPTSWKTSRSLYEHLAAAVAGEANGVISSD